MDLAHARSLIPAHAGLHVEEHKAERDAAALHRLACWALRYSPVVAVDPPDGLLLDATGLERLYPGSGEVGLTRAIGGAIYRLGFSVRIAIASTFACAQALARFGNHCVTHVPPGKDREALAPLPIEALCVDPQTESALKEIGLVHAGHVLDLPCAALAAQFGDGLLGRVNLALGLAPEILDPVRLQPPPRAELVFDGPTAHWESIEAATRDVLDALIATLTARGQGTRQLNLELLRPSCRRVETHRVQLSCASRSRQHWWAMLRPVLERIDAGPGIEGVAITASGLKQLLPRQRSLGAFGQEAEEPDGDAAWGEIVDTLVSRLGVDNVVRFKPMESHLPERAFRTLSVTERTAARTLVAVTRAARPTRLFDCPLSAAVMLQTPDGPILHIAWSGRKQNVIASRGPERIGAEWWRSAPVAEHSAARADRDYFAVQTSDGTWLWIGRQVGTGQWFVHGDWA